MTSEGPPASNPDFALDGEFSDQMHEAWHRYVDLLNPLRPDLFRFCRRLTGNVWEAEDLVQETLIRGFATLGQNHPNVKHPRAYLLRAASNAWIDGQRRRQTEDEAISQLMAEPETPAPTPALLRDAGAVLYEQLSAQERAAVVLKEVFELSLAEIGEVLQTTSGAVKAALHRSRSRLQESNAAPRNRAQPELVDRFVAAFNASDMQGLLDLFIDGASVEQLGCATSTGKRALEEGFLDKALHGHPEWPEAFQYESSRLEAALLDGEPIALGFVQRRGREALEQVMRFQGVEGRVSRIRAYAFCPETMREVAERLGLKVRTGLYRYPTAAPGENYS